jgi:hypothetical protein
MPLKPVTYIDVEFLVAFAQQRPDIEGDATNAIIWLDLFKFIKDKSEIVLSLEGLDSSKLDLPEYALVKHLINLAVQSKVKVAKNLEHIVIASDTRFPKYKMASAADIGGETVPKYHHFTSKNIISEWSKATKSHDFAISRQQVTQNSAYLTSWNGLEVIAHPISRILISDPYLIMNYGKDKTNLHRLLKTLLVCQSGEVQILFITEGSDAELMSAERSLKAYLTTNQPSLSVTIGIVVPNRKQHGRYIFTDYYFFKSDHSFDYFIDRGGVKLNAFATLSIVPHVKDDSRATAKAALEVLKAEIRTPLRCIGCCASALMQ